MIYNILKSIHIFSVIAWMAGLLYLPRIFMYHADTNITKETSETFKVMERRLLVYIMNPAMIVSWILGVLLIHTIGSDSIGSIWLQLKLVFVIILTIYHFFLFHEFYYYLKSKSLLELWGIIFLPK